MVWNISWSLDGKHIGSLLGVEIPQKILWNNSINIKDIIIDWPTPKDFEILGLTSLGYEEKVIFPLTVKLKEILIN